MLDCLRGRNKLEFRAWQEAFSPSIYSLTHDRLACKTEANTCAADCIASPIASTTLFGCDGRTVRAATGSMQHCKRRSTFLLAQSLALLNTRNLALAAVLLLVLILVPPRAQIEEKYVSSVVVRSFHNDGLCCE